MTATKACILTGCLVMAFSGGYPPGFAQRVAMRRYQELPVAMPVITTEDALQDDHIATLNTKVKEQAEDFDKKLSEQNDKISKQFARLNQVEEQIAGMQGEERGIGAILGILSGFQILLQLRKKKESA